MIWVPSVSKTLSPHISFNWAAKSGRYCLLPAGASKGNTFAFTSAITASPRMISIDRPSLNSLSSVARCADNSSTGMRCTFPRCCLFRNGGRSAHTQTLHPSLQRFQQHRPGPATRSPRPASESCLPAAASATNRSTASGMELAYDTRFPLAARIASASVSPVIPLNRLFARPHRCPAPARHRHRQNAALKSAHQVARPRKAMRLKQHQHPPKTALARRLQCCLHFRRVMTVVVNHRNARRHALALKAAVNTTKRRQPFRNLLRRNPKLHTDRHRRRRVQYIVLAPARAARTAPAVARACSPRTSHARRPAPLLGNSPQTKIRIRRLAIRVHAPRHARAELPAASHCPRTPSPRHKTESCP